MSSSHGNQPRAFDALDARYEPLDVVVVEEQRSDERVGSGGGDALLAALHISIRKHRDLYVSATDWAHFS